MIDDVAPLLVLQARAEARAILYAAGEFEQLKQAVVPLLQYAIDSGIADQIGAERAFAIVKAAFAASLRTPPGEKPGVQGASKGTAALTGMHAGSGGPHPGSEAAE
jgi:hypothetical protein